MNRARDSHRRSWVIASLIRLIISRNRNVFITKCTKVESVTSEESFIE